MSGDDKLAQAQAALQALGTLLQGLNDVASAASALSHQQKEQAHDAAELEQRLRSMAERLAQPTRQPTALQQQLRAALLRAQAGGTASTGLQPDLQLHHGDGARPAVNVAELRRQAQLAAHAGLDQQPSGAPDVGEQVLRVAQLCAVQGLQPEQVLAGVLVGAARYAHEHSLPSVRDWPELLGMALHAADDLEP